MNPIDTGPTPAPTLRQRRGPLAATLWPHGALATLRCGGLVLNLFPATALEAGAGNLWLRRRVPGGGDGAAAWQPVPLLGPASPGRLHHRPADGEAPARAWQAGRWQPEAAVAVDFRVELVLAEDATAWFWHVALANAGARTETLDLVLVQDTGLAPWPALRLNEAYTSHYLDQQPLAHADRGWLLATRQNLPTAGRHPWLLAGSLGRATAWATDGLQLTGRALRAGDPAGLLRGDLPSRRLQHEHALVALQEAAFTLAPGEAVDRGFFGLFDADHPAASGEADLQRVAAVRALPEAVPPASPDPAAPGTVGAADPANLFALAPAWAARQPVEAELRGWFGDGPEAWRHVERGADGGVLAFFAGDGTHVVTRAHELAVMRPHGQLLRSGAHWTPDEQALASTVWMAGVFHSSLTQGHASSNRLLSTQRGHLGVYRGLGLRVFVDTGAGWRLLALPSAFAMRPAEATWVYAAEGRVLEVCATADAARHRLALALRWREGDPAPLLVTLHLPLNSADAADDGWGRFGDGGAEAEGGVHWRWQQPPGAEAPAPTHGTLLVDPAPGSALAQRFGGAGLVVEIDAPEGLPRVQGDEALFLDGASRGQPWLCLRCEGARSLSLGLEGRLVADAAAADARPGIAQPPLPGTAQPPLPRWQLVDMPGSFAGAPAGLAELADWLPWLGRDALVHYLTPRGLEQFSGGGWGTRDVCQGPAELLLSLGRFDALRDLLCRVFSAQNPDGDWPQWFMFHPRDAAVRAGDSHGDIVFWPLVALADYLRASGDAALLDQPLPYHGSDAALQPLAEHVQRALAVVRGRTIAGTALAAYGHGDWNDALQPADPALRERLCSAWTVTLHHRMLCSLAEAWRAVGRGAEAARFERWAGEVLADFQRLLLPDGVLAGYALFEAEGAPGRVAEWLLHPRDARTGIGHSALAMVHAIVDGLFTPEQAAAHVALIGRELTGPDGLRLFDRPLRYRGGTMALFQRGESAAYFGREIGLMYMHAHLRWAEALAQLGDGEGFWRALRLANPIGLEALVPQAAPRQRNCYYSSSDAAFADREEAWAHYDRVVRGEVVLEGGWRVYSSGAGIAWRLVLQRLLGVQQHAHRLGLDPVLPAALDGLQVELPLYGHAVTLRYRVGHRGHGPSAVLLDGEPLPLQSGHNPYRLPGVWLDAAALRAQLAAGRRSLTVVLGGLAAAAA